MKTTEKNFTVLSVLNEAETWNSQTATRSAAVSCGRLLDAYSNAVASVAEQALLTFFEKRLKSEGRLRTGSSLSR
jgi:hypothetical protein